MSWYDVFSRFYDASLERLYEDARARARAALDLQPGERALDLPCGTGQSFDGLAPALGDDGHLIGVDLSAGMLARARQRVAQAGWGNVTLVQSDVHKLSTAQIEQACGAPRVDALHVFLGLSAFPEWRQAARHLLSLVRPGGRFVVVDVFTERLGLRGRMVNLTARADITRRFWEPLERAAPRGFSVEPLPSLPAHGGTLHLARGVVEG